MRLRIRGSFDRRSVTLVFNEPLLGEDGRKWLGKPSKCSKLVKDSSESSQNVQFRRIVVRMDFLGLYNQVSSSNGFGATFHFPLILPKYALVNLIRWKMSKSHISWKIFVPLRFPNQQARAHSSLVAYTHTRTHWIATRSLKLQFIHVMSSRCRF